MNDRSLVQNWRRAPQLLTMVLAIFAFVASAALPARADSNDAAIVVDANTGQVLFESQATEKRYPASLTKMMTLYLLFELMESGQVRLDTPIPVSSFAAAEPPTKLGVKPGTSVPVETAIVALVTISANDLSTAIAEFIAGSETLFAARMTAKAQALGMMNTQFRNAHGLPDREQFTTARDMAILAMALREHFPQYYHYFSATSLTWKGKTRRGHNHILKRIEGADGLKTGYINASGFNVASSFVRDGRRVVAVVMGGSTYKQRDDRMVALIDRYMSAASRRYQGPFVPARRAPAAVALFRLPEIGPVPVARATYAPVQTAAYVSPTSAQIASIIGSNAGSNDAIAAALAAPQGSGSPYPVPAPVPTGYGTPPAAVPAGTPTPQAVRSIRSSWGIQLAAAPSQEQAMVLLADARSGSGMLASAQPYTEPVVAGGMTLYRARYGGFASREQADAACEALIQRSYGCYLIAP